MTKRLIELAGSLLAEALYSARTGVSTSRSALAEALYSARTGVSTSRSAPTDAWAYEYLPTEGRHWRAAFAHNVSWPVPADTGRSGSPAC